LAANNATLATPEPARTQSVMVTSTGSMLLSPSTEVELVESWGLTARRSCGITEACGIHKGAG
jgi:hypothetical protein